MKSEIYPAISVDRRLAGLVDDIEFDYDGITEYMRRRGFSDEQILRTTIAAQIDAKKTGRLAVGAAGEYFGEPGDENGIQIALYPEDRLVRPTKPTATPEEAFNQKQSRSEVLGILYSETLVHELEHKAVAALEGGMPAKLITADIGKAALMNLVAYGASHNLARTVLGKCTNGNSSAVALAPCVAALATRRIRKSMIFQLIDYWTSPEEIKCRSAQQNTPEDLVVIEPRLEKKANIS